MQESISQRCNGEKRNGENLELMVSSSIIFFNTSQLIFKQQDRQSRSISSLCLGSVMDFLGHE